MDRVAFLIEPGGDRIDCLLNPESLTLERRAGLRVRADATGVLTGHGLSDDPLQATGGGATHLDLRLLFDTNLAAELRGPVPPPLPDAPPPEPPDVRALTRPLWNLAENGPAAEGLGAPPRVRFIWGSAWNVLGVVVALAERLDRFTATGVPQRAWIRLRLRRVAESETPGPPPPPPVTPLYEFPDALAPELLPGGGPGGAGGEEWPSVLVAVAPDGMPEQRPDQISAAAYGGDPRLWPLVMEANGVDDPLQLPEGQVLRLPPRPGAGTA
jgi:hypothetical protein